MTVNDFLIENLWMVYFLLLLSISLIVYSSLLLSKARSKKKFLAKLKGEEGPLSPRNLLTTLIDSIPDFIYIKDKEGRFIVANKKLADTVGELKGEFLIGNSDYDYYDNKLADQFRLDELEIMNSGNALVEKTEKGIDVNGNDIWVSTSKIPIMNENGEVVGIAGIGRDITETKVANEKLVEQKAKLEEVNTILEERQEEILQQQEELKTQTEKLALERNQLLTLVNSMPDRIYIKDRESRFILGNKHVSKIMGAKTPEELIGKRDFDFYPKDMAEAFYNDEQEMMANDKKIINKEETGLSEDGRKITISTTKIPIKNDDGEVIGVVGIGRDITRQKMVESELKDQSEVLRELNVLLEERQEEIQQQAEELKAQAENLEMANKELEKLSAVASKTGNVIIIMDKNGDFEWVNDGFVRRYSMSMEEFIAKHGKNILNNSYCENIDEIYKGIIEDKKPRIYNSKSSLDGKIRWSQTTISPILNEKGEIINLIAIDSDISKLKEAEIQIESQRDELRKVNATKDKFFSIIAHDLKNPFHSIMGFSELLTRSYNSIEESRKREFIKLINESSTSAYGLLENLLNWARTQTNKIKYEPSVIDVRPIIDEVLQMVYVHAENKGIKLYPPQGKDEILAYADRNMINTVIRNLVSNALKFTEQDGSIDIETKTENNRLFVSISDSGVGMDEETRLNLFNLESLQTSSGTSGESGTGLGLIVCKEFVIMHGGKIDVDSSPSSGSTFTFDLPVPEEDE